MSEEMPQLFDTIALLEALPERGLRRGQVGTLVEELAHGIFEVEFSDLAGRTCQLLPLQVAQMLTMHHSRPATLQTRNRV